MNFDRELAKKIQEASEVALRDVAKKFGVNIKPTGGTLGDNEFTMKMKIEVVGVQKSYPKFVFSAYGLPEDIIGKIFTSNGIKMTVREFATKAPKYPIICDGDNGKSYKFSVDTVKMHLKIH